MLFPQQRINQTSQLFVAFIWCWFE